MSELEVFLRIKETKKRVAVIVSCLLFISALCAVIFVKNDNLRPFFSSLSLSSIVYAYYLLYKGEYSFKSVTFIFLSFVWIFFCAFAESFLQKLSEQWRVTIIGICMILPLVLSILCGLLKQKKKFKKRMA